MERYCPLKSPVRPWFLREVSANLALGRGDFDGEGLELHLPRPYGTVDVDEVVVALAKLPELPVALPAVGDDIVALTRPKAVAALVAGLADDTPGTDYVVSLARPEACYRDRRGAVVLDGLDSLVMAPAGFTAEAAVAGAVAAGEPSPAPVDEAAARLAAAWRIGWIAASESPAHAEVAAQRLRSWLGL